MANLMILGAAYGPADVTAKVRSLVSDDGLTVTADNHTFGDVWPGKGKSLMIVYQHDQSEHEMLTLQADFGSLKDTWPGVENVLVVVYQYHGVPQVWIARQGELLHIEDCAVADQSTPISRAILDGIGGEQGPMARKTYDFTTGNAVTLFQTPGVWGSNYSPTIVTKADEDFLSAIHEAMAQAEHGVDITTLWPLPSGKFLQALRNAIAELSRRNAHVTMRRT